jgi:hypothetical protein
MKHVCGALVVLAACGCGAAPGGRAGRTTPPSAERAAAPDPDPDMNAPDRRAWMLFLQINRRAPVQTEAACGRTTNNAVWETWADDTLTFPEVPDCSHPPQWPRVAPPKTLRVPAEQAARKAVLAGARNPAGLAESPSGLQIETNAVEEIRRNRAAFDFVVSNDLWYRQGLQAAFTRGMDVRFPLDAVEIKADWTAIEESQKGQYHWNYDSNGKLFGLVALHVISKALPMWTWATFEWTGNPGRCDFIGCHDGFGAVPADVAPNEEPDRGYPAGKLTPALRAAFRAANVPPEWQNYRLKGTQTGFTDATGRTTLLGNSVTERGFAQTSSCMTCHGQASVDKSGAVPPHLGFTPDGQSTNGPLLPQWFYDTSAKPWTRNYVSMDFIWAVFRAKKAAGAHSCRKVTAGAK